MPTYLNNYSAESLETTNNLRASRSCATIATWTSRSIHERASATFGNADLDSKWLKGSIFGSALYASDTRKDYGEPRTRALGTIGGILYSLVFTMRGSALRVISLRRASRRERKRYAEAKS